MTELQEILKIIQFQTGLSDVKLAARIGWARETIGRADKNGYNDDLLIVLKSTFKTDISHFVTRYANLARVGKGLFPDPTLALEELKAIQEAAARIEAVLKPKGVLTADIRIVADDVKKAGKGKQS